VDRPKRKRNLCGDFLVSFKGGFRDTTKGYLVLWVNHAVASQVVTFTLSDFARTFVPNGNLGTDHAWGSHHIVMGGAVRGGDFYGVPGSNGTVFPMLAPAGPDDTDEDSGARGRSIPMVAVDQYGATLAAWFGLGDTDRAAVLPHLGRFRSPTLGFLGEGDTGTLGFFEYLLVHQFDTRPNTVPIPPERVFGHTLFVLRG